jgi:hypothetical protein
MKKKLGSFVITILKIVFYHFLSHGDFDSLRSDPDPVFLKVGSGIWSKWTGSANTVYYTPSYYTRTVIVMLYLVTSNSGLAYPFTARQFTEAQHGHSG